MDPVTIGAAALAAPAVLDGVGNLWDSIFGDDEAEAHRKALQEAQRKMWAYRPEAQDARMNVMGNMSHAFAPMNNALTSVYGPGAAIDIPKMLVNPFPNQPERPGIQPGPTDGRNSGVAAPVPRMAPGYNVSPLSNRGRTPYYNVR